MKRKLIALVMALATVCALGLAGCGGGGGAAATPYDTGVFSVEVASGWTPFAVTDVFSEDKGANPDALQIGLGAKEETDLFKVPYIDIRHYGPKTTMWISKDFYDKVVDLEPMKIGDRTWQAFTGESLGYALTVLYTGENNEDQFQVTISQGGGEGNELPDVNDPAIQSMIASIALSGTATE